jgi:TatD DNase family protein
MYLVDTHTHIYLPEFNDDRSEMLDRARTAGVGRFILPAIDSGTHEALLQLTRENADCLPMMGLHPCSVNQRMEEELALVSDYLPRYKFIAIGEIGLDFYWDKTYVKEQYAAFHRQIELALQADLPIVIHSRNATDECIEVVQQYPGLRGVFHCFSGDPAQAGKILEAGMYLGIGGVLTFKNSGLDKVMEQLGLEQVVLETDAPYLAPVPYRGKRNEPAYVALVVEKLAALKSLTVEEVQEITTRNANKLFNL